MEVVLDNDNFTERAFWLVKLRWFAIALLAGAAFLAGAVLKIAVNQKALYAIALCLLLYNAILFLTLVRIVRYEKDNIRNSLRRVIILQVSADLFVLTGTLYFSGSVENPFTFYYVFHMIIAGMLFSRAASYLQATLAILLFGTIMLLEYLGILRHYPLTGFLDMNLHRNGAFLVVYFLVFATTLYFVVYMTTSIVAILRTQQLRYRHANEKLKHNDRIKNEYVVRITHDIKGHLAAIKSCLDIVIARMVGPLNEKQADLIQRADDRSVKCMTFIKSVLKLTRMRLTGKIDTDYFSIKTVVFDSIAAADRRASDKKIALTQSIDPAADKVFGNSILIEDTLTNILFNAVKYTPAGGAVSVTVTVTANKDYVTVQVSDTGIGIPPADIGHIFEEFFRAENAKAVERDGTGLGLALAKEVIERHGGRIWVRSDSSGSTFAFTIPTRPVKPPTHEHEGFI